MRINQRCFNKNVPKINGQILGLPAGGVVVCTDCFVMIDMSIGFFKENWELIEEPLSIDNKLINTEPDIYTAIRNTEKNIAKVKEWLRSQPIIKE